MNYNVRAYFDTGFNSNNIPDSPNLLDNTTIRFKDYDAVWLYQNQEVGAIRVKASFTEIYPADYVRVGFGEPGNQNVAYYFVNSIQMLNPVTAQLNLSIDAVTTIGLDNIIKNIKGGWCTRRSVTDDTLFSNNIDEDFQPAEPLVLEFKKMGIDYLNSTATIIIASTLDLDSIEYDAKTYIDKASENTVTVPLLPLVTEPTTVRINIDGSTIFSKVLPNVRLYNLARAKEKYLAALQTIWSLGAIDSISAIYILPAGSNNYVTFNYNSDGSGAIDSIVSAGANISSDSGISATWSSSIKNNKVFCDQFNKITVASFTSGDSLDYNPSDIYIKNFSTFRFRSWFDPAPGGKTYIRPSSFQGLGTTEEAAFFQCVTGSDWLNSQTAFEWSEGWAVNAKIYSLNKTNAYNDDIQREFNILKGLAGVATGGLNLLNFGFDKQQGLQGTELLNSTGGFMGSTLNQMKARNNKIASALEYNATNNMVSPTIKFPRDKNLVDLIGNGFFVLRSRLSDNDSKRFDRYLTEYGYAVNEPLTPACFTGRRYFNYISCTDLNIGQIGSVPMRLKDIAVSQLEGGVRIWHSVVVSGAYDDNPIVTS